MSSLDRDLMMPDEPQNKCTCRATSLDECICDYDPNYGEPKKFAFDLVLHINEFEAASIEEAEKILNGYIDRLAQVEDAVIQWDSLDLTEVDTRLA